MSSGRMSSSLSVNGQPPTIIGQGNNRGSEENERLEGKASKARKLSSGFLQTFFHRLWLFVKLKRKEKLQAPPVGERCVNLGHPGQESIPSDTGTTKLCGPVGTDETRQPPTLADLPEDILLLISDICRLEYIPLGSVSSTCRRLRGVYSPVMFEHITVHVERVSSFGPAGCRPTSLLTYGRTMKVSQELYPYDSDAFQAVVYPLLDQLPLLSTVVFEGNTMFDLELDFLIRLSALSNLQALHITRTQLSPGSGDIGLLPTFCSLRRLSYSDVGGHHYRNNSLHPDDEALSREAKVLMKLLLCASETIEELDVPPESVDWALVENASFPNLRRLKLFGWPMRGSYPLIRFLSAASRIQVLSIVQVPLESVGQEIIWPAALIRNAQFARTRTPLSSLSVLRISNPVLEDRIYDHLPEGLHTLSLVPYRSGVLWALRQSPCPMLDGPSLQSLLQRSPLPFLRVLAVAFIGYLPAGFVGWLCTKFPSLVRLELHRWDRSADDSEPSAGAMSHLAEDLRSLRSLRELRLNLSFPDAVYYETREDDHSGTPAQKQRDAARNAYYEHLLGCAYDLVLQVPSLHSVWFLLMSDRTTCRWRGHTVQRSVTGITMLVEEESGNAF